MTAKRELHGSNLRARTDVVRWLDQHGRDVQDSRGLVAGQMRADLGKGKALGQLLAQMEADGMIERDVAGRRTRRIALVDDWGLLDGEPEPQAQEPDPQEGLDLRALEDVDLERLAETLLAIVLKRASQPMTDPGAERALAKRAEQAERDLAKMQSQLRDARAELAKRAERESELAQKVKALENNLGLVEKELKRRPKGGGVSIRERLSADDRKLLDQLMRTVPGDTRSR